MRKTSYLLFAKLTRSIPCLPEIACGYDNFKQKFTFYCRRIILLKKIMQVVIQISQTINHSHYNVSIDKKQTKPGVANVRDNTPTWFVSDTYIQPLV